jgi:hypothetical protein
MEPQGPLQGSAFGPYPELDKYNLSHLHLFKIHPEALGNISQLVLFYGEHC